MTDIIEKIRARHKACDHIIEWPDFDSFEAYNDRATLLRLLDEERARRVEMEAESARTERNRDMWKGQCERQAGRLTVLNRAVAEISRGVQSGVDPQASIDRLVSIARNAAPEIVSSEAATHKDTQDE